MEGPGARSLRCFSPPCEDQPFTFGRVHAFDKGTRTRRPLVPRDRLYQRFHMRDSAHRVGMPSGPIKREHRAPIVADQHGVTFDAQ
jgi:hypothetical protein